MVAPTQGTMSPTPANRPTQSRPVEPPADWVPQGQAAAVDPKRSLVKTWSFAIGAALLGAVVWGFVSWKFEVEVGYVAWAIGLLAAGGALASNGMRRHASLVTPAIIASLLGIVVGKFLGVYFILVGTLSFMDALRFYIDLIDLDYGLLDAVFAALAVYTAWRLTRVPKPARQAA